MQNRFANSFLHDAINSNKKIPSLHEMGFFYLNKFKIYPKAARLKPVTVTPTDFA